MFKLVKKLFSKETIYKLNEFLKDIFFLCSDVWLAHTFVHSMYTVSEDTQAP